VGLDERATGTSITCVLLQCVRVAAGDSNEIQLSEDPEGLATDGELEWLISSS